MLGCTKQPLPCVVLSHAHNQLCQSQGSVAHFRTFLLHSLMSLRSHNSLPSQHVLRCRYPVPRSAQLYASQKNPDTSSGLVDSQITRGLVSDLWVNGYMPHHAVCADMTTSNNVTSRNRRSELLTRTVPAALQGSSPPLPRHAYLSVSRAGGAAPLAPLR